MRVAFYSHTPLEHYGGGEVTLMLLANAFARRGHTVTIRVESGYPGSSRLAPEEVRRQLGPGILYGTMPFGDRKWAGFPSIWRSTLPDVGGLKDADAHLFLLPTVPDRRYLEELAARRIPALFLLHSLTLDRSFRFRRRIVWNELLHHLSLLAVGNLPPTAPLLYQVLNERSAELLRRHGVPADRVRLIPTGIDVGRYRVDDDGGAFRVLFVGRLEEPWKGIDLLRRTIERTLARSPGPIEFVVLGSGEESAELGRWAAGRKDVRLLGFVPESTKVAELARASVLLSTSGSEPYGLTSVEGLASGLPLVATPTAGSSYLVDVDPMFGSVGTFSEDDLADRILAYRAAWAADPERFRAERRERRRRAAATFDLPPMFAAYDRCLDDLTAGRRDAAPGLSRGA